MKRIGLFLTVGTLLFLAQLSHLSGAQPGEKLWEFELFEGGLWTCPAIGTDGTVYVGAHDSKVYALHGATGQKRWEFPTAGLVQSSPAIGADGTVYVGSRGVVSEGRLYALDGATGQKRWEFLTFGPVLVSPAIGADGTVYLGGGIYGLCAVNGATGQGRWAVQRDYFHLDVSSPAIGTDGTVYVVGMNPRPVLYAVNGATGDIRWTFSGDLSYDLDQNSSPAIGADGTIYVGGTRKIYALNAATGEERWEFPAELGHSYFSIGADGTLYVGASRLYAMCSSSVGGLAPSAWPKFGHDALKTGHWTKPPAIEEQPSLVVLHETQEGRITVRVSGQPTPQVQWFFNGTAVATGTNETLVLPAVTRAQEGTYWLAARNPQGQEATSAPIVAVVSNVDPDAFAGIALHWTGPTQSEVALEGADHVGPGTVWRALRTYPAAAGEQRFRELTSAAARFYRLNGLAISRIFAGGGWMNGWPYAAPVGTRHRIEYTGASAGWTNWRLLTNLVLPSSPYLFLDYESLGETPRLYRTTPVP